MLVLICRCSSVGVIAQLRLGAICLPRWWFFRIAAVCGFAGKSLKPTLGKEGKEEQCLFSQCDRKDGQRMWQREPGKILAWTKVSVQLVSLISFTKVSLFLTMCLFFLSLTLLLTYDITALAELLWFQLLPPSWFESWGLYLVVCHNHPASFILLQTAGAKPAQSTSWSSPVVALTHSGESIPPKSTALPGHTALPGPGHKQQDGQGEEADNPQRCIGSLWECCNTRKFLPC